MTLAMERTPQWAMYKSQPTIEVASKKDLKKEKTKDVVEFYYIDTIAKLHDIFFTFPA